MNAGGKERVDKTAGVAHQDVTGAVKLPAAVRPVADDFRAGDEAGVFQHPRGLRGGGDPARPGTRARPDAGYLPGRFRRPPPRRRWTSRRAAGCSTSSRWIETRSGYCLRPGPGAGHHPGSRRKPPGCGRNRPTAAGPTGGTTGRPVRWHRRRSGPAGFHRRSAPRPPYRGRRILRRLRHTLRARQRRSVGRFRAG